MIRILYILVGTIFLLNSAIAQENCNFKIEGIISDATERLAYANVVINNEQNELVKGDISNQNGEFVIDNLCEGTYRINISYVGLETLDTLIQLKQNLYLSTTLKVNSLSEILISEKKVETGTLEAITLKDIDLSSSSAGTNLAGAIADVPGVTFLKTSTSSSKPVIHGLHGSRILILNNGVRQEGQQWNNNYAPEIDPFLATNITVIQGASSVRYGADAIGGVVIVEAPKLRKTTGIDGNILLAGRSNNRQGTVSGMLEGKLKWDKLPISWRVQGTANRGGDARTANYYLENTGLADYSFSYALGYEAKKWGTEIFYSLFNSKIGVYKGSHTHNLTDIINIFEGLQPPDTTEFSYEILRPRETATHELFKFKTYFAPNINNKISLTYARQFNRHEDFDINHGFQQLAENSAPNMRLKLTVHSLNVDYEYTKNNWKIFSGISGLTKRNTFNGLSIIPRYKSQSTGAYILTEWRPNNRLFFDLGFRYDFENRNVELTEIDSIANATYSNFSFSIGNSYRLNDFLKIQANIGTAFRPSSVNELYSAGVNHGEGSYESGTPTLNSERVINASTSINFNNQKNLVSRFSLFYKYFPNYIYLTPLSQSILTIRGFFPSYKYVETEATFRGFDYSIQYKLPKNITTEAQISVVRAWNEKANEPLILIPPDQYSFGIGYEVPKGDFAGSSLEFTIQRQAQQTLFPDSTHLVLPPPAFNLFNIQGIIQWRIPTKKNKKLPIQIGLSIENLFNKRYRIYMNRMRYFADEPGRNISLKLKIPFTAR